MHSRRRPRQQTAFAVLALALGAAAVGCSSSGQPPATITTGAAITGAGGGANASPGAGTALPSGLSVNYQFATPTGAGQPAMVGLAEQIVAHYETAVAAGDANRLDVNSLLTGPAGGQLYSLVKADIKKGTRPTGTIVFSRMSPETVGNTGSVGMCENDQETTPVDIGSGRSAGSAPTGAAAVRAWEFGFAKNSSGTYQLDYIAIQAENRACI